ncbi:MAG: transcriptional regulator GcvA [Alphaproteobacteria bacterium]|nr:transcriptional regulator GcvA [Alphaproteobacteria bacterium]
MAKLPSLNALRAFDVAARHLNFSEAATELFVTPAAISHQIKTLEADLGTQLFVRGHRVLSLTEAGRTLSPVTRDAFEQLAVATRQVRDSGKMRPLNVACAPSFGAKWLIPRLHRFRRRQPDLDIRIDASPTLQTYGQAGIDIGIRYGSGVYKDLDAEKLLGDEVFPVCSPRLLERGPKLEEPRDLIHHVLLHDEHARSDPTFPEWSNWLAAAGATDIDPDRGDFFNQTAVAYQAANDGQGVLLAKSTLAAGDIAVGRLVRLFDVALPVSYAYYLVYPRGGIVDRRIADFRSWILDEVAADRDNAPNDESAG